MDNDKREGRRGRMLLMALALLTPLMAVLALAVGASGSSFADMLRAIVSGEGGPRASILLYVRLPRVCAALLAGAALAASGHIIQSVMSNPLAGPNIIGVNAGAGFCVVLQLALFPVSFWLTPLAAFIGALCAALLAYAISRRTASRLTLVLAGVALSSVLGAGTDAITTIYPDVLVGVNAFKIGGFAGVDMARLAPSAACILPALICACALSGELDVLSLGDETARSLGMNTRAIRGLFLMLAALLAGAAVSFAGLIGFVGLMVPHIVRMILRSQRRHMLPCTMLMGALTALICDTLSRVIFRPYELPVGIMLSALGGVFFIWLLITTRGGRELDRA